MNKTEEMVLGFRPPVANWFGPPSCRPSGTPLAAPMGARPKLRANLSRRIGNVPGSLFHRWDARHRWGIAGRVVVEGVAMAGTIFFAALATLLFGL